MCIYIYVYICEHIYTHINAHMVSLNRYSKMNKTFCLNNSIYIYDHLENNKIIWVLILLERFEFSDYLAVFLIYERNQSEKMSKSNCNCMANKMSDGSFYEETLTMFYFEGFLPVKIFQHSCEAIQVPYIESQESYDYVGLIQHKSYN